MTLSSWYGQAKGAIPMGWLDGVFDDMAEIGYSFDPVILPAAAVGAPHIRSRIWWIATEGIENENLQPVQTNLFGEPVPQRQKPSRRAEVMLQILRHRFMPSLSKGQPGKNEGLSKTMVSSEQGEDQRSKSGELETSSRKQTNPVGEKPRSCQGSRFRPDRAQAEDQGTIRQRALRNDRVVI